MLRYRRYFMAAPGRVVLDRSIFHGAERSCWCGRNAPNGLAGDGCRVVVKRLGRHGFSSLGYGLRAGIDEAVGGIGLDADIVNRAIPDLDRAPVAFGGGIDHR